MTLGINIIMVDVASLDHFWEIISHFLRQLAKTEHCVETVTLLTQT